MQLCFMGDSPLYTALVRFDSYHQYMILNRKEDFGSLLNIENNFNGFDGNETVYMGIVSSKKIPKQWDIFINPDAPILKITCSYNEVTVSGKRVRDYSVSFEPYLTNKD